MSGGNYLEFKVKPKYIFLIGQTLIGISAWLTLYIIFLQAASKMSGSQRTKLIPAKVTSKIDSHRPSSGGGIRTTRPASSVGSRSGELGISGVAPPMSSVIVERHQPVSKVNTSNVLSKLYLAFRSCCFKK